jgi:hypothetical protein
MYVGASGGEYIGVVCVYVYTHIHTSTYTHTYAHRYIEIDKSICRQRERDRDIYIWLSSNLDKRLQVLPGNKYQSVMKQKEKEEKAKEYLLSFRSTHFPVLSRKPE